MPDREKVIKGLECCITDGRDSCKKCYQEGPGFGIACRQGLMRDALELLKGQEPAKPRYDRGYRDYNCPACGVYLLFHQKYCNECGRALQWE